MFTLKSADATVFVSEKYAKKRGFWRLERGCIVLKSKNVYLPLLPGVDAANAELVRIALKAGKFNAGDSGVE